MAQECNLPQAVNTKPEEQFKVLPFKDKDKLEPLTKQLHYIKVEAQVQATKQEVNLETSKHQPLVQESTNLEAPINLDLTNNQAALLQTSNPTRLVTTIRVAAHHTEVDLVQELEEPEVEVEFLVKPDQVNTLHPTVQPTRND